MDKDIKREALRQYLHYFRIWFILLGVIFLVFLGMSIRKAVISDGERGNDGAPAERVFDYADVLTDQEEEKLRELIARKQKKIRCDLVLVTINKEVENSEMSWESSMRGLADDFYDQNNYGYNKVYGDGALLLDNWYEEQEGSWLSTCGAVMDRLGSRDIDEILEKVSARVEKNPYQAYRAYVEAVSAKMEGGLRLPWFVVLLAPFIVFVIFVAVNMQNPAARDTTGAGAYVAGGKPAVRLQTDQLVRQFVTTRHIERSSSGSGGSGGGGSHTSSGGVSHGGGESRR